MFGKLLKDASQEGKEKHVPVIHAPEVVKPGEYFPVTVIVGKEVPHPNTVEHHIKWIQVFAHSEGSNPLHIATFDMAPVYGQPVVTFNMKIDKPATLYAVAYCNIHGLWESSADISI